MGTADLSKLFNVFTINPSVQVAQLKLKVMLRGDC